LYKSSRQSDNITEFINNHSKPPQKCLLTKQCQKSSNKTPSKHDKVTPQPHFIPEITALEKNEKEKNESSQWLKHVANAISRYIDYFLIDKFITLLDMKSLFVFLAYFFFGLNEVMSSVFPEPEIYVVFYYFIWKDICR